MQHRVLERVWPGGAPPNTPPALMGQTGLTAIPDFALQPGTSSTIQCPHPIPEFNQSPPILDHFAYRFFRLYSRRIEPDLPSSALLQNLVPSVLVIFKRPSNAFTYFQVGKFFPR